MSTLATILLIAFGIELATLFMRFGAGVSSKGAYIWLIKRFNLKYFIHIHHGFTGVLVALIGFYLSVPLVQNIGFAMILSDLFHHFVVLWTVVGSPEFHVIYKNRKAFQAEQRLEEQKLRRFMRHLIHHFD